MSRRRANNKSYHQKLLKPESANDYDFLLEFWVNYVERRS